MEKVKTGTLAVMISIRN